MLRWSWKDTFGYCLVRYNDGKYRKCKLYYANCYFGTCIATWKEEDDKKGEFHYTPVFFFSSYKHAKRCIQDDVLDIIKKFVFFYNEKDKRTLNKEIIDVAKLLIKQGTKVEFKYNKKGGKRR